MNNLANEHLDGKMTHETVIELVNYLRPMIESDQFKKSTELIHKLMKEHTNHGKLDLDSFIANITKKYGSEE